jgi:hypothetical protein
MEKCNIGKGPGALKILPNYFISDLIPRRYEERQGEREGANIYYKKKENGKWPTNEPPTPPPLPLLPQLSILFSRYLVSSTPNKLVKNKKKKGRKSAG